MTQSNRTILALSTLVAATLAGSFGEAQADSTAPIEIVASAAPVQLDVELDPLAYALGGYSLHSGFELT